LKSRSIITQNCQVKSRVECGTVQREVARSPSKLVKFVAGKSCGGFRSRARGGEKLLPILQRRGEFSASDTKLERLLFRSHEAATPKRNRRWRLGGRLGRIMRVEYVGGATWEEAMPPLAPSDRSPTATPELNCSATYPELPSPTLKSGFLRLKYVNVAAACCLNLETVLRNLRRSGSIWEESFTRRSKATYIHRIRNTRRGEWKVM